MLYRKKLRRDLILKKHKNSYVSVLKCHVYVPSIFRVYFLFLRDFDSIIFKIYSPIYYFNLVFCNNKINLYFDRFTNNLILSSFYITSKFSMWLNWFINLLFFFTSFFFKKIKFRGKGYYLYKNYRNTITPQFGYSHRIYFYSYFLRGIFLTKTKVLFFGFNKSDVLILPFNIRSKRFINIFTGRGVRFSEQIIYKKIGKVSLYR